MSETIKIWLVGNTGLRNPNRIQEGFAAYAGSPFVGNLREENEVAFMNFLNEKGIIQNEAGKDESGSHARKWRLMFSRNGFIYPQLKKKDGKQEELGPLDEITPFGRTFLKADTYPAVQDCFLRSMSVEQYPMPDGMHYFSPLRWLLAIMLELERRTGKRRKKRTKQIKRDNRRTHKRVSRTDPESGHLKRPGKSEGPHYLAHQAVDSDYGIIVGQTVTAGDVNDSVPFLGLIERIHENVVPIQTATADAAYDFPLAHRVLGELGIDFFVRPQKTAARVSVQFTRDDFYRDENRDVYLCPGGKELRLKRLARSASGLFWEYQADQRDCALCPLRDKCLREDDKRGARKVSVSYFAADRQRNLERRSSPEYRDALKLRQVWCEGSFSAQKREHNLARILRRGLEAAEDHCLLSATALNLKRMIKYAG